MYSAAAKVEMERNWSAKILYEFQQDPEETRLQIDITVALEH